LASRALPWTPSSVRLKTTFGSAHQTSANAAIIQDRKQGSTIRARMPPVLRVHKWVSFVAAGLCLVGSASASASSTVIDTRNDAQTNFISSFGVPDTTNYGQVITAPPGETVLSSFTFRVVNVPSTVVIRGEVYAWDGAKATGSALFESSARTTSGTALQDITFDAGATPVNPGSKYVLFATAAKDFEISTGAGQFRTAPEAAYPNGNMVYLNSGTNESLWTSTSWTNVTSIDLQFRARFDSGQALSVTKSGTGTGTVTSSGGAINCGPACAASFGFGTVVALQANPDPGSAFLGFAGAGCSSSPCLVTMNDPKSVNALFADIQAPETKITKRRGKKITFTSSEPNSTFVCSLDGRKARPCTSPYTLKKLRAGRHTFTVVATDAAGNRDASPAKLRFRIA
jgi:Divergent InlB B-repeat domain